MAKIYCFITLLTTKSVDSLFSSLLRKGFGVQRLAERTLYSIEENIGQVLAIELTIDKKSKFHSFSVPKTLGKVRGFLQTLCNNIGINYFSIILTEEASVAWCASNVNERCEEPTGSPYRDPGKRK